MQTSTTVDQPCSDAYHYKVSEHSVLQILEIVLQSSHQPHYIWPLVYSFHSAYLTPLSVFAIPNCYQMLPVHLYFA